MFSYYRIIPALIQFGGDYYFVKINKKPNLYQLLPSLISISIIRYTWLSFLFLSNDFCHIFGGKEYTVFYLQKTEY